MILMGIMISMIVCALAVLYGIVTRKAKPIICAMFLMVSGRVTHSSPRLKHQGTSGNNV